MRIDLDLEFVNLKGETIKNGDLPLTLRDAASEAIASVAAGSPDKSLQRLKLARRIFNAPAGVPFELTTEEASEIKSVIAQMYQPIVAGQAVEMIEAAVSVKEQKPANE